MKSRMERYYETDVETSRRTRKNADLYQKIYENDEYNNIEGIATTLKSNEIDISKIKEMLKEREEQHKQVRKPIPPKSEELATFHDDEKNYDIRDVLSKAKDERKEEEQYHKLRNTSYDIFKNLDIQKEISKEEVDEVVQKIENTSVLNQMGDQELSLGLLDELKSDTMVGDASAIKEVLEEEKRQLKDDNYLEVEDDKANMDKSFFTSSLNFKDDDFDELQEMGKNLKKNHSVLKVLIFILLVVVTVGLIFFFLK